MSIVPLTDKHIDALLTFLGELPGDDVTLIKEDITNPDTVRSWPTRADGQWVAERSGTIAGYAAVRPLPAWSDHVGELRLVVHPAHRRQGFGRALSRHALTHALASGLSKVVVELVAEQDHALELFLGLGFTGEALLRDHIRDRTGALHDLVMLAHSIDTNWSAMDGIGLTSELGLGDA